MDIDWVELEDTRARTQRGGEGGGGGEGKRERGEGAGGEKYQDGEKAHPNGLPSAS